MRKTQKDLINQIKGLELRLQEAGNLAFTPSLANIELKAGAKSEMINSKDHYSQTLQLELEEKQSQIRELQQEHELYAKSL
jgi:hypothetical protein